jgi:lactoylglutathione lyase
LAKTQVDLLKLREKKNGLLTFRINTRNIITMKKTLFILAAVFLAGLAGAQKSKTTLNHIALYVQNLQRSTAFYKDIVQLDTIPEPFHDGRHTWFRVAERSHLHLISGATPKTEHDKNSHLCFSVPSVEAFIQRLVKAGIPYEDWPGKKNAVTVRVDGIKQIYFQDPDGYWVEINNDYL